MRLIAAVVGGLLVTGCSGGGSSGPSFDSPLDIAAALIDAGYECEFTADDPAEEGTDKSGNCEIERENVQLLTFKDNGQRDNYFGLGKIFGCGFAPGGFTLVNGDRWVIQPETQTLGENIADKLGADVKRIECD